MTSDENFLSYEDELLLSDALYARRVTKAAMEEEGRTKPNRKERKIIQEGDKAANLLVEAYLPFAYQVVSVYYQQENVKKITAIDVEDLQQVAAIAMITLTNAFDARGAKRHDPEAHPGVRFATYVQRHVRREIGRHAADASTSFAASVTGVSSMIKFWGAKRAAEDLAMSRNEPVPTDEEIAISIKMDPSKLIDVPLSSSFLSIDHEESPIDVVANNDELVQAEEQEYHDEVFRTVAEVVGTAAAQVLMVRFGIDRGFPRSVSEIAEEINMSQKETKKIIQWLDDSIRHPKNRVRLAAAFKEFEAL